MKIEYTTNGTTWIEIIASTANDGLHAWLIPDAVSATAKIRISEAGGAVSGESNANFGISAIPKTINITSPNGGEQWEVASPQNITWTSTGAIANVKIEYTTNGTTWTEIIATTANDGLHAWLIPKAVSATSRIRITEAGGAITGASDASFEITPSSLVNLITLNQFSFSSDGYGFSYTTRGEPAETIKIFNFNGMCIREIHKQSTVISWDGLDHNGNKVDKGVYFVSIKGQTQNSQHKIVIFK